MDDKRKVGERIRACRVSLGLTLEQLGAKIGYSQQRIGHYERGLRLPTPSDIRLIAGALQERAAYLMGLEDEVGLTEMEWGVVKALRAMPENERTKWAETLETLALMYRSPAKDPKLPVVPKAKSSKLRSN